MLPRYVLDNLINRPKLGTRDIHMPSSAETRNDGPIFVYT